MQLPVVLFNINGYTCQVFKVEDGEKTRYADNFNTCQFPTALSFRQNSVLVGNAAIFEQSFVICKFEKWINEQYLFQKFLREDKIGRDSNGDFTFRFHMADTVYRVPVYILLGTFLKSMAELLARQTNDIIKEIELELPNAPQERLTNSVILKQAIKESGLCVHLKFPPPETSAFPFQR